MDYDKLVMGIKRFGATEQDICASTLRVPIEKIHDNVIIAPWWEPHMLPDLGEAELISPPYSEDKKTWNIMGDNIEMTYIKTGIGAPYFMDSLLPLGLTGCKRIVFIGSVGSMDIDIGIGDIVIPEYSVCGDGASRYIASDDLNYDVFGEKAYPDSYLLDRVLTETSRICGENNARWHKGRTFSTDTIFAQYAHMDVILAMGCNVIEMETAAAFRAAKLMKIPLAAIFSVSDNTVTNKSLISGRTAEEMEYRKTVRRELFPQIILSTFKKSL